MLAEIKALCKQKGISLYQLEQSCGLGKGTLSRWDNNAPSVDKVVAVASYFGVSLSEIVGETKKLTPDEGELAADERMVIEFYRQASPEIREMILKIAKG